MQFRPLFTHRSGSRWPKSKFNPQVADALMPHLVLKSSHTSHHVALALLRRWRRGRNLGTITTKCPSVPRRNQVSLPEPRCTMFSAKSCSAAGRLKILVRLNFVGTCSSRGTGAGLGKDPGNRYARGNAARSKHMEPVQVPGTSLFRYSSFCSRSAVGADSPPSNVAQAG